MSSLTKSVNVIQLEDVREFPHQVAGHVNERLRRYGDAYVLKPLLKADLFYREVQFYEEAQSDEILRPCLPSYYGLVYVPPSKDSSSVTHEGLLPCMMLEDLSLGFSQPCLIDIKIGRQTFEPSASQAKKSRELAKYPHQEALGFRITGLKVWDVSSHCYRSLSKVFGRSLEPDQVIHGLGLFFHDGLDFRREALQRCLEEVEKVGVAMKAQSRHLFFCSSLLIVYDGDATNQRCIVRMIDFAHVVPKGDGGEGAGDEGYIYSADSLHKHLSMLLDLSQRDAGDELVQDFLRCRRHVFSIKK